MAKNLKNARWHIGEGANAAAVACAADMATSNVVADTVDVAADIEYIAAGGSDFDWQLRERCADNLGIHQCHLGSFGNSFVFV